MGLADLEASILDFPFTYGSWTGNRHRTTAGDYDRTYEKDTDVVKVFDFARLVTRDQREGSHQRIGGDLGIATEQFRFLALIVQIKRSSHAALEDALSTFERAFDVQEAQIDSPSTRGIRAFSFYTPTAQAGYTSPVRELYFARPDTMPQFRRVESGGKAIIASTQLICEDPRRYLYTAESIAWSPLSSPATLPNWTATIGRLVHPILTIVMSGNGASNLTIADGTRSLVLDMSAAGAGTFTVDSFTQRIYKGSADADDLRTSDPDTFPLVPAGGASWTMTNRTNVTSASVAYRQAR